MQTLKKIALVGPLVLGLSACTVTTRANVGLLGSSSNLIARVTPDKGEGATYLVGEPVRVSVTTRTAGYVTILALNQDRSANVLVRNAYVAAGTTTFPRAGDGVTFNAAPPAGTQSIRVIFTRPRPTTDLVLSGVYDSNRWNTTTTAYLTPYAAADRDVQETYIYIR
ncbi:MULTISPECIES: DUF4384 domain-containing protein [Deinococcus]|uniref:DUF4384 domain-containing protein n=1 Tax=Deinococcus cavernae TaxID=2320857 RepID=A0A418V570_9DEIO|nr:MULTISPECIES: DUF4384 domain-containing protein [Deinococcus]RJF71229.1 DUF4384 domain-containing protein [Deinococcus cavernae]